MSETRYIIEYRDGEEVGRTPYEVSDEQLAAEGREKRVRTIAATLDQFAADQKTVVDGWSVLPSAQKDAALKRLHERFGKVCGGLADLVRHLGAGE
jgi:ribosomal protein L21E